jgi:hypothetical protein
MNKEYTLFRRSYRNDNTAEYGFGDYPELVIKPVVSLFAKSTRDAQGQLKKFLGPKITFSGKFAPYFVEENKEAN